MTQRWTFYEVATGQSYTVPINPDSMTSPFGDTRSHTVAHTGTPTGPRTATRMNRTPARDWEFSGPIRTREHHDALETWAKKPGKVHITDHLGRTFVVMFRSFEATDRKPTPTVPWRLRYTMKTLLLRRLS